MSRPNQKKLSDQEEDEVRKLYAEGVHIYTLKKDYGVSDMVIRRILFPEHVKAMKDRYKERKRLGLVGDPLPRREIVPPVIKVEKVNLDLTNRLLIWILIAIIFSIIL